MHPSPHEIVEMSPGIYGTLLHRSSCQVLRYLLVDDPDSVVWLVAYHPFPAVEWREMPLPLAARHPPELVEARLPRFDLQFSRDDFLARLPRMHAPGGMLALQMARPVPDALLFDTLADDPDRHAVLREHGWLFSFDLPRDGEHPWIESPDRAHLERVLAHPLP